MLELLKHKYSAWKDARFLKKHRCDDWAQYHHRNDPDVCYGCSRIKDFYRGYPHQAVFCNANSDPFNQYGDWLQGLTEIKNWTKDNCTDKWRHDFHRVMRDHWSGDWEMNELGGGDYLFFAFKSERDCLMFNLRWL